MAETRVVWKFELTEPLNAVVVPGGASIIHVHEQNGNPCLWVLVNPAATSVMRYFYVYGTGHEITEEGLVYVGTAHILSMVFHVFEKLG